MKPEPRNTRKRSTQFEPQVDTSKHVMMCDRKAKSDVKLGKAKTKLAKRKQELRVEAAKLESSSAKEERRKKEKDRKKIWRQKQKEKLANVEAAISKNSSKVVKEK